MTRSFLLFALMVGLACDPPPTEIPPGSAPTTAPERPIPPPNPPPSRPIEMDADAAPVETPTTVEPAPETGSGGPGAGTVTASKADGQACKVAADCQSGICEGQGCTDDKPGTCASKRRACTTDLRPYCGCDGTTFRSSSSCPGRRFDARGECKK
jgi:hypothetical protein